MSVQQHLEELAELSPQIEAHRTAIWLLERRQVEARERLIASGWHPREAPA